MIGYPTVDQVREDLNRRRAEAGLPPKAVGFTTLSDVYPPNSEPQRMLLETPARIAIIGGSAGGGKTIAEFLDLTQHVDIAEYGAIIFRRTLKMHKDEGGLWDKSITHFPKIGGRPNVGEHFWTFPSGAAIQFAGMENEASKLDYQGAEIPKIVFDELTHFLESQFFYLLSRNRWPSSALKHGKQIPPTMRGSCNPEPGWVKRMLAPWVDRTFPNPAKSGEIRWFVRENNQIVWIDGEPPDRGECHDGENGEACFGEGCLKCFPPEISITFIRLSVYDNKEFLRANPEYVTGLKALPEVDRKRLLDGDWDAKPPHLMLDAFDETRNVVSWRYLDPKLYRFYIGADFGGHNTAEICLAEEIHTGHLTIISEDWPGHSRTWDAVGTDVRALLPPGAHIHDGAGGNRTGEQGWREAFRSRGIPMREPDPDFCDPKLQYMNMNTLFKTGQLDVFDTCTKFIDMANRFMRKIDAKTGDVTDDFDDAPFHLLAAGRYILVRVRPPEKHIVPFVANRIQRTVPAQIQQRSSPQVAPPTKQRPRLVGGQWVMPT